MQLAGMEEARELEPPRFLDKILPPRPEESVVRATAAAKSRATLILAGEDGGSCLDDPQPESTGDVLMAAQPERDPPGPCAAGKGATHQVGLLG